MHITVVMNRQEDIKALEFFAASLSFLGLELRLEILQY